MERTEIFAFEDKITGGRIPREYIPSVKAGAESALTDGVLAGYPLVGVKMELIDGRVPRGRLLGDGLQDRRVAWRSRKPPRGLAPSSSSR